MSLVEEEEDGERRGSKLIPFPFGVVIGGGGEWIVRWSCARAAVHHALISPFRKRENDACAADNNIQKLNHFG